MIKLDETSKIVRRKEGNINYIQADLISDTSDEVKANGTSCANIKGIMSDEVLDFGSTAFSMKDQGLLTLDSTGAWN